MIQNLNDVGVSVGPTAKLLDGLYLLFDSVFVE